MPIYCVVMSDVKQESLANAKVGLRYKHATAVHVQCMKAHSEEIYGKSTQGT